MRMYIYKANYTQLSFYSSRFGAFLYDFLFVCLSAYDGKSLEHSCPHGVHLVVLQMAAINTDEVTALII